jgi:SAM-dependent methyltransferase
MQTPVHGTEPPSAWVRRWIDAMAPGGHVLDLACGRGRHARLLAQQGFTVLAVDRDREALESLAHITRVSTRLADLEGGARPLDGQKFDAVVVTNYLHRPLFPDMLDSLVPGGLLVYETFASGNERFGKPSNPDFLLRPGELLEVVQGRMRVLAFEDLEVAIPKPAMVQRICARMISAQV